MFKKLRTVLAASALTVAAYAVAADTVAELRQGHPDTYTVRHGDTLWDISARFLEKPWLWPEIWQANPQIDNPHQIYPGDVISLAYANRVTVIERRPEVLAGEPPLDGLPLADIEPFLRDLRMIGDYKHLPYVVGLDSNRLRAAGGQSVYVQGLDAQPGQRFSVVRPAAVYADHDPKPRSELDFRGDRTWSDGSLWKEFTPPNPNGELLGYELARVGFATVEHGPAGTSAASTVTLENNGHEVRIGDRLIPAEAQAYDLRFFPHPPAAAIDRDKLRVLAVAENLAHGGPRDVIAISGGVREGIDNGTVFSIWRQGSHVKDNVTHRESSRVDDAYKGGPGRATLPDEYAGHAMVFRTFDKVSYALVMEGTRPVKTGYTLKHPDAEY